MVAVGHYRNKELCQSKQRDLQSHGDLLSSSNILLALLSMFRPSGLLCAARDRASMAHKVHMEKAPSSPPTPSSAFVTS